MKAVNGRTVESDTGKIRQESKSIMWMKELEAAKYLAVEAGKVIMEIYNDMDILVEYKSDHSPLTAADKAANEIIAKALKNSFPSYAILSEEEKDDKSRLDKEYCFIVDPLDGTKEFLEQFTRG